MTFELNAIERSCAKYGGGLKSLALVDPDDLDTQPVWYLTPDIASLDFLPGKAAYIFAHDRLSATLTGDTDTGNDAGDFFQYRLSCFIRHQRGEADLLRAKLVNRRVHVIATYFDGSQRFIPNMRLSAADQSGERPAARQGYAFTGQARLTTPAPWLQGSFDVIGGPYVPPEEAGAGATLVELTATDPTYSYIVPVDKWLCGIEIRSTDAQTIKIGTTAGGEEISGMPVELDALEVYIANGALLSTFSGGTIHFTDLEGTNSIRIWLLG